MKDDVLDHNYLIQVDIVEIAYSGLWSVRSAIVVQSVDPIDHGLLPDSVFGQFLQYNTNGLVENECEARVTTDASAIHQSINRMESSKSFNQPINP